MLGFCWLRDYGAAQCFQDVQQMRWLRCGVDSLFALLRRMDHLGTIARSSWTQAVAGCFVMEVYLSKLLVVIDYGQGPELRRFFPGSFAFSLDGLVTPGFEEGNGSVNEILKVIVTSFHRLLHLRHTLAGYDLVICLRFHPLVLVNFQLNLSILVLLL